MNNILIDINRNKFRSALIIFILLVIIMFVYKPRAVFDNKYIDSILIELGFSVKEIDIIGLKNVNKNQIIKRISYYDCFSLLCINLKETKKNLEQISWINSVSINLVLPSILKIKINEEHPSFVLKGESNFVILSKQGKEIEKREFLNTKFANLLILEGKEVKNNIYSLMKILDTSPVLAKDITNARLISKRRWSLKHDSNIIIDLPELKPEEAFKKISDLNKKYGLLSNKLEKIDLRINNRMIIKMKTQDNLYKESKI